MTEFKIGDKVTYNDKEGVITDIKLSNGSYPICVEFSDNSYDIFTCDGFYQLTKSHLGKLIKLEDANKQPEAKAEKTDSATKFIKFDDNKPRPDLIEPEFLLNMGKILKFGCDKYSEGNWKNCEDSNRYYAAALRHLLLWKSGETTDPETNISHLVHAGVNLMFLDYLTTKK